jgi:protease secretion system outer membrane protein
MKLRGHCIFSFAAWIGLSCAWAGSFQQAYEGALANDPTFRAARQELASSAQGVPIARASLLPQLSLSVSDARVTGSRTAPDFLGQPTTTPLSYRAPQQTLSMRAPLLDMEARRRYQQARVQLSYAETLFRARQHDLLDRVAQACLQRLFAQQNLQVSQAQLRQLQEQRQLALRQFELGDGTRPEAVLALADLGLARVQLTEARSQMSMATLALAQLTGISELPLQTLPDNFTPPPLMPASLQEWIDTADVASLALELRRYAVELARVGVARANAGHYPRLDLVASVSKGSNESVSTLNQQVSQRSIGLQLNLPLYSGGLVVASIAQALAEQEKALAELDAEKLKMQSDIQRLFLALQTGADRLAAQRQVVDASRLALEGAQKGFAGGVSIQTEVVRAQVKLTEALRDLAKTRYEYLLGLLRLHARAGTTPDDTMQLIDQLLRVSQITAATP